MTKKFLYIFFICLFYFLHDFSNCKAIEYCHIHENGELKETIELPFYFYKINRHVDLTISMPTITYTHTTTYIDSLTKCELINYTIEQPLNVLKYDANVYHTSKNTYSNTITSENIFNRAKYYTNEATIRGYSSIVDTKPPSLYGYQEHYKTNIDKPLDISIILSNISAYDDRDGNLTENITIEYSEYSYLQPTIGIFPIILSVEDSSSNKTSLTIYIEVIDTSPPIIEGETYYISYLSSPLTIEKIKTSLKATDNVDNDLTSQIYVCEDNFSINKKEIGLYTLYFCLIDSSSNTSNPFKIEIEVKDDIIPLIEGLDYYTSKLSKPLTVKEIMYSLAAIDNGKDISESIFVANDYYSNYLNTLGEKSIYFQVMDDSSNISEPFKVTINLIDDVSPQIFGLDTYTSYMSSPLSLTYLSQQLTVMDNFDGNISTSLEIIEDTYSNNINKIGTYSITYQAKDYSSNLSEIFKMNITNIDDVAPTIQGPSNLKYSLNNKPTLNNILSEFKIVDNIDNDLELTIESDSYSESLTTGTYYITLSAIDKSCNKSSPITVKIELVDILLNLNEIAISLPNSKLYSQEEINKIINFDSPYKIIQDTYSPNYNNIGEYKIEYELEDYSKIIITINTYQIQNEQNNIIKEQKKETLISKIKDFFKTLLKKIKDFLKKIKLLYIFLKHFQ